MIEAKELVAMQPKSERIDLMDELLSLQDLRTRMRLLVDRISVVEKKAAQEAISNPREYNTKIENVQISTSEVLWILGYAHKLAVVEAFDNARKAFDEQIEAEKGEQDGEAVRKE